MNLEPHLQTLLKKMPGTFDLQRIKPLGGDASSRRYFRLHATTPPNLILMQMDPATQLRSEEGPGGRDYTELPFLSVQRLLKHLDWPVPEIFAYDQEVGLLILEDFGDLTLEAHLAQVPQTEWERCYRRVIDILVSLQVGAAHISDQECEAFDERFDEALLFWELWHFFEYGLVAQHGEPPAGDRSTIEKLFRELSQRLAALPPVLVHRDFHSRNIMVHTEGLGILDFQDALLGPREYDLASLLRDSYVVLPEPMIDRLLTYYYRSAATAATNQASADPDVLREHFDLVSLQRNLKAAGRFVFIARVKGNDGFLQYIPHTLDNVRHTLQKYAWLHPLQDALGRSIPALKPR